MLYSSKQELLDLLRTDKDNHSVFSHTIHYVYIAASTIYLFRIETYMLILIPSIIIQI